jgi:D-alanine-D-alanine ligase
VLRIGIAYSAKPDNPSSDGPDDLYEEFDKPETIEALAEAIRSDGHDVSLLGDGREFLQKMLDAPPDFVFNFAEGQGISRNRESRVPAVCEMLRVSCSGSDPLTMAAALDKDIARVFVDAWGGACPNGVVFPVDTPTEVVEEQILELFVENLSGIVILKPNLEGSSKGIRGDCLATNTEDALAIYERLARDYHQPILVEEFIDGDEVTVGVLGNGEEVEVLGIMKILPKKSKGPFVYSLEVKRDYKRRVKYETPAKYPEPIQEAIKEAAILAYKALGCRDVARIDFRVHQEEVFFIEVNPLPGLAPATSDLVILAEGYGISHAELVRMIVRTALKRVGLS